MKVTTTVPFQVKAKDGSAGRGIVSANVFYASNTSSTSAPADTAFTMDSIDNINVLSGYYIWQATKITYTDGTTEYVGKMCLGKADDFASIVEVYSVADSGTSAPNDSTFATSYTPVKGKWLWGASKVTGHNASGTASSWLVGKHCVLQFPEDGTGLVIDLTNRNMTVPLDEDGHLTSALTLTTEIQCYNGITQLSPSSATVSARPSWLPAANIVINSSTISITIPVITDKDWLAADGRGAVNTISFDVAVSGYGSRVVTLSLTAFKSGGVGENAQYCDLMPQPASLSFKRTSSGGYSPTSQSVTIKLKSVNGASTSLIDLSGSPYTCRYSFTSFPTTISEGTAVSGNTISSISPNAGKTLYLSLFTADGVRIDFEDVPIVSDGAVGQSTFKSTVFKRAASQPTAPSGGSYGSPVPSGWSDGIPAEDGNPCWMSTRIFTSDGQSPQQSEWTAPCKIADTADFDVCFSAYTNCYTAQLPAPGSNTENTYWHNVGTEDDIWMATSTCSNGVWSSWSVNKIKGENGDKGANSHAVTFSPATLNFETNDYGTVTGDLSVYVEPIVENGVVSSIILGTPVHCTAGRDSSYKKFCISAIAYEKFYDSSGKATSAISSAAYKIPYATGYVPVTVNFTDITTGKSDSKTVNYDWTVNLAVFMGVVFSDNKSYYSKFTAWTNGYTSASQVFQDAKTWVAEQSYTNENSIRTIYAGIGVGNGKIVGMSNNFALYKPIDGVTVKDIVNNSNNTYDKYRTLYWDGSAWRFTGKIYAEAGEFRGKVTATEGDIGCLHIDGSDYLSVKDSSGNDSVVISQKTIPSYVTPFSNQALAFNYASAEENEVKTYSVPCNVTAEGGETTAYSARFYAPIAKRDALSYVGVTLAATCKIASFTRKTDNVYGNIRVIMLYLVAKDGGGNVKYQTSPNVITMTPSSYLSSDTSYSVCYTVFDTSLYYYLKVVTLGAQETTVSVTATASYTQNKVLNFLGKDGALFGYSAKKNVRIKNGEMFINGYPALALIAFFKVSEAASVVSNYKATGVMITASLTTKNAKPCFFVTVTGLTAGSRPMVFLDGLHLLDGSTNRYTKATLVESSFSSGTLSFYVYTSEGSGQRNLPFECKILDISTVQTHV